jgi:hypothetical protein
MKVFLGPYKDDSEREVSISIDNYDTWSMDSTLSLLIHPMLVQLKATQHGHPANMTEQEWNEILDEMIWAFEQKCRDEWESDYYEYEDDNTERAGAKAHQERMSNGFRLFGKYYENLWD